MRRPRRTVLTAAVAAAALTAGLAVTALNAWAATATLEPSTWAYVDSQAPTTPFLNQPGDAPLGTTVGADNRAHTYRSYFTFDLTLVRGQVIHFANFYSYEMNVTNCNLAAPIDVRRTRPIRSGTTWRNPPVELELIRQFNRGAGALCPGYVELDLVAVLNGALARRESSVTIELRVAQPAEADPALGRTMHRPGLFISANHVPSISDLGLIGPDRPCGTIARHPTGNNGTIFKARATDPDSSTHPRIRFAVWSLAHPDQRREFESGTNSDGTGTATTDLSAYPEGALLAWAARADDRLDVSPWSKPCYLSIDRTAPATAPVVASALYREGNVPSGGPGVKGRFRFSGQGDRDIVAFSYADSSGAIRQMPARRPGGTATVDYTPTRDGPFWLYVTAIDAAGNRGLTTEYRFFVRNTAPSGSVDVAGVGLPSRITLSSSVANVTGFSYQLPGGAEVKFPATNGTGSATVTFPTAGYIEVMTRAYVGPKMVGAQTLVVIVSDAPGVESAVFQLDQDAIAGITGTFTFRPHQTGVVAYVYDFGDGQQRIAAAADGTAVLEWTATVGRFYVLEVQAERSDGSFSEPTAYYFNVIDTRPFAYATSLNNWPRTDGVGLPLEIWMESWLPNLTGFAYRFNGGSEQTVTTDGNPYAIVNVTPEHAGENGVVLQALLADGTRSPATTYTFTAWSGPVVTWDPSGSGTVGRPVTFMFHPGLSNVTEYRYSIFYSDEQTVAAGSDGTATVTYTPTNWGNVTVRVTSVSADGTVSDPRDQYFDVRDNKVSVYSGYSQYSARGGIGTPAYFQFSTQLFGEVVEYRFHVDDEPQQVIPASTEGTSTSTAITLHRNGLNTLYVQSLTAAGELSPVTEYRFLVGTAPHVVSAQYPDQTWAGGAGIEGTFEFSGGTDGIVSFDYQLDSGPQVTVAADAEGRASITYTPQHDFETHNLYVTGHTADGTMTDGTSYYFYVFTAQ